MKTHLCALLLLIGVCGLAAGETSEQSMAPGEPSDAVKVMILLDKAGFSPGEIDGEWGKNAQKAASAFQQANGLTSSGQADKQTLEMLGRVPGSAALLLQYTITPQDAAGPFVQKIDKDPAAQAKLPRLSYRNIEEMLGERFHCSPELLKQLNKGSKFAAGEALNVPNVEVFLGSGGEALPLRENTSDTENRKEDKDKKQERADPEQKDQEPLVINVSKSASVLTATRGKTVVLHAPVTSGSEHDPLPIGEWKVQGVERNPKFNYNPELFWDAGEGEKKVKLPPGPNGPVGVVWIDISKPHYGLHGTPEPGKIGYSESHGCVRLTNWDAMRLAKMVRPGTKVYFVE